MVFDSYYFLQVIEIADITTDNSIVDFFGAGSVVGEMAVLKEDVRNASVICETDVQVSNLWPMKCIRNYCLH